MNLQHIHKEDKDIKSYPKKNNTNIYQGKCKNMHKYTMFMDWRTQFKKLINSHQTNLQI